MNQPMENVKILERVRELKCIARDQIRGVVARRHTGFYLYGSPGTGKTAFVQKTLDELDAPYHLHCGYLTPFGLFELIENDPETILVLDDVSSLLTNKMAMQILMAALAKPLDPSKGRRTSYKRQGKDATVEFRGGIIFLSNLPLGGTDRRLIDALKDRVQELHYELTNDELAAEILALATTRGERDSSDAPLMVARYLLEECARVGRRPTLRLFLDMAIPYFEQWSADESETHWMRMIQFALKNNPEDLYGRGTPLPNRADNVQAERESVLEILRGYQGREQRLKAWREQTGKGSSSYYRRLQELRATWGKNLPL